MNQLETLNLEGYTELETLDCFGNRMVSLDVRTCTKLKLENVQCGDQLTSSGESRTLSLHCRSGQGYLGEDNNSNVNVFYQDPDPIQY